MLTRDWRRPRQRSSQWVGASWVSYDPPDHRLALFSTILILIVVVTGALVILID